MALTTEVLVREGFGQLEPNHLSAQRNGQIYAQLPANKEITQLHNAQFVKYDYAAGEVNFTGEGEWMLVYNEVKLYESKHSYKDFVLDVKNSTQDTIVPRVFKTMPGDLFTTNLVEKAAATVGTNVAPNEEGILATADASGDMVWKVVKLYTMADGQPAVKVQRVK